MTLEDAKKLKKGDIICHKQSKNGKGEFRRYKITSVKTWVKSPEKIKIGLKWGLYVHEQASEFDLPYLFLESEISVKA